MVGRVEARNPLTGELLWMRPTVEGHMGYRYDKDGKAIEATPGLADVKGVNNYLAWPVVQYVNYAPGIRKEMLRMINAYLEHVRPRVAGSR